MNLRFSRVSLSGGLLAIGGEVFLNWRRLITKDVMHHLDPLPLVVGELHQLVLAHLEGHKNQFRSQLPNPYGY